MLPEGALVKAGDKAYTWRLKDNTLSKVDLVLGKRDQRTGNYEIERGLAGGDTVLRTPNSSFKDGQKVERAPARVASASVTPASTAAVQGK
jgi:membrane fusion protein (multidrug efflux system)